jgi:hypothetical protein
MKFLKGRPPAELAAKWQNELLESNQRLAIQREMERQRKSGMNVTAAEAATALSRRIDAEGYEKHLPQLASFVNKLNKPSGDK